MAAKYSLQKLGGFGYNNPSAPTNVDAPPALPPFYSGKIQSFPYTINEDQYGTKTGTITDRAGNTTTGPITVLLSTKKITVNLIDSDTACFCPPSADKDKYILRPGWNPASVLLANPYIMDFGDHYQPIMSPNVDPKLIMLVWALHLQEPGYPVYIPFYSYSQLVQTDKDPQGHWSNPTYDGGIEYKYDDALKACGGFKIKEGTASQLMSIAKNLNLKDENAFIKAMSVLDQTALVSGIIYHFSPEEIVKCWDTLSIRYDEYLDQHGDAQDPKWQNPPLPPGSLNLTVNGSNVNFRSTPDTNKSPIANMNSGDKLIQITGPINDFWYALKGNQYGYVSTKFVDAEVPEFPPLSWSGAGSSGSSNKPADTKTVTPANNTSTTTNITNVTNTTNTDTKTSTKTDIPDQTNKNTTTKTPAKDNTLLYIGIGAGVLVLGTVLVLALKPKKHHEQSHEDKEHDEELAQRHREMESA